MRPLVSVYIPTKNRVALLSRAVESVLTQSYKDIEIIIVDDGSCDGTPDLLLDFSKNKNILTIRNENSVGACASRNLAIKHARGRFVTGLDDDDYFFQNRISTFVDSWDELTKRNARFGCLFDQSLKMTSSGTSIVNTKSMVSVAQILMQNHIGSQIFCMKDHLIGAGLFRENLLAWQDWDMWVRLLRLYGPAINIKNSSYMIDESHSFFRISNRPEQDLRDTFLLFCSGNAPISLMERAAINLSLCKYPQVKITSFDLLRISPVILSFGFFLDKLREKLLK